MSENNTSDKQETPRTDAVEQDYQEGNDWAEYRVVINFARQLERELAEAADRLAGAERHVAVLEGAREARENEDLSARGDNEGVLRLAQSALRQWTELYGHLQNDCGEVVSRKLDYNLPPANHLKALEAIEDALTQYVGEKG